MNKVSFKYKEHPGDLLRSTDLVELPDPYKNTEEFLIWFLVNYNSDERVGYFNDLFKLLDKEFSDEVEEVKFLEIFGKQTDTEIRQEIAIVEDELRNAAFRNFYNLILNNKIEIIIDGKK